MRTGTVDGNRDALVDQGLVFAWIRLNLPFNPPKEKALVDWFKEFSILGASARAKRINDILMCFFGNDSLEYRDRRDLNTVIVGLK